MSTEQAQIGAAIAALENQRSLLGDAVVDMAVAPLKAKLAALRGAAVSAARTRRTRPDPQASHHPVPRRGGFHHARPAPPICGIAVAAQAGQHGGDHGVHLDAVGHVDGLVVHFTNTAT